MSSGEGYDPRGEAVNDAILNAEEVRSMFPGYGAGSMTGRLVASHEALRARLAEVGVNAEPATPGRCPECDSKLYAGVCYSRGCALEGISDPLMSPEVRRDPSADWPNGVGTTLAVTPPWFPRYEDHAYEWRERAEAAEAALRVSSEDYNRVERERDDAEAQVTKLTRLLDEWWTDPDNPPAAPPWLGDAGVPDTPPETRVLLGDSTEGET